jgi:hypothetical protein
MEICDDNGIDLEETESRIELRPHVFDSIRISNVMKENLYG